MMSLTSHGESDQPETYFAPAARASHVEIDEAVDVIRSSPLFDAIQQSIDGYLMILNAERQVLAVNPELMSALGICDAGCLIGQRPGELLKCVHVKEGPGGCGTSCACRDCGAVLAILESQSENRLSIRECLATVERGDHTEALEFRVRATPVMCGGYRFTVLLFTDVSNLKRREALERTFFHDVMNTVSGLLGYSSLLTNADEMEAREIAESIVRLSQQLTREIQDQRKLIDAENGNLVPESDLYSIEEVFESLRTVFSNHGIAHDRHLVLELRTKNDQVLTDETLLGRVLVNMVKNAFEAIARDETVTVSYERLKGVPRFVVHNPGRMPEPVARQIFQRSFSTKGRYGRGLGTYSMKLFGERYLGGKVWFETSNEEGTRFMIELPR